MSEVDAEVIVVGGGHNGLICAAYLARAGIDTMLVEARSTPGGCASTVDALGARFNICNCDHTMVRALPLIDELELGAHGLSYVETDVTGIHAFYDDAEPWLFYHQSERVLDELSRSYPTQVDGYRRYLADALPVASLVIDMAATVPGVGPMLRTAVSRHAGAAARLIDWSRRSASDVLGQYFDDWHLVMPVISVGPTVWGVPPQTPGTGLAALGYAIRHLIKTGRPAGGSGALTDAISASFVRAGGQVCCEASVDRLLVKDGSVHGVRLADGRQLTAQTVIAACDPQRVLLDWIDEPPAAAKRLVDRYRRQPVLDGYESKIDAVFSELPTHRWSSTVGTDVDLLGPTTVVSPSPEQLAAGHELRTRNEVSSHPTLLFNMPTVPDPTMTGSSDVQVLSLEVLFTPYALKGGWPDSTEPARWFELWASFMEPGSRDHLGDWRVMTPDRYEAEFSMHRGHTPAFAGSPLSALVGKPSEVTRYRTPIEGLYLTGAGTYPGAGVFGAAGRNAAAVVSDARGKTLSS